MIDPEFEKKRKDHLCLYGECNEPLDLEDWTKGLCPLHSYIVAMKKRLFPKELPHVAYGDHDGYGGYGVHIET